LIPSGIQSRYEGERETQEPNEDDSQGADAAEEPLLSVKAMEGGTLSGKLK